jgi:vacuolar protein sorting-associated protein 26
MLFRYFIKVTIGKRLFGSKYIVDKLFLVNNTSKEPELNASVKLEMGIDNIIQLQYELYQTKYHTDEAIIGRLLFHKCLMEVKFIELHLYKKETIGYGILYITQEIHKRQKIY